MPLDECLQILKKALSEPYAMNHPRSLGISAPSGKDVYEIYLVVKSRPSVLAKISDVMGRHGVDMTGVHAQVSDDRMTAHVILYAELGGTGVKIEELLHTLKEQDFVIEAKAESREKTYFENMMFPLTSGGHYRVFTIGGTAWASLVASMMKKFGAGGETILHEEGLAVGRDVANRIAGRFTRAGEKPDQQTLVDNLKGLFKASGFGLLDLTEYSYGYEAKLTETVSTEPSEPFVDHFLVGVVRGAMSIISGSEYLVRDSRYEGKEMKFRLERIAGRSEEET